MQTLRGDHSDRILLGRRRQGTYRYLKEIKTIEAVFGFLGRFTFSIKTNV